MSKGNGFGALERIAKSSAGRSIVPVLGSGFVTQAVHQGALAASASERPKPVDWMSLLRGVALEMELEAATRSIKIDVPGQTTLLWDAMVTELAMRAPRTRAAHHCEARMRQSVARRLREDVATVELSRPFVQSFLDLGFNDVLMFNFDSVLLPPRKRPTHRVRGAARRASLAAKVDETTIWFPHGHLSDPESIVLGAHAYGVRIAAMQAAFDAHARRRAPRPSSSLDTWVATVLERPLLFVGLSLTREEWTIWWLLSERARFLARRPRADRPPAFVFARRPSPAEPMESHAAFSTLVRACELLGLSLLEFADFAGGWKKLEKALGWTRR
ncbi:MAG: SIR2 family protein [Polyangiaceae bacterium]